MRWRGYLTGSVCSFLPSQRDNITHVYLCFSKVALLVASLNFDFFILFFPILFYLQENLQCLWVNGLSRFSCLWPCLCPAGFIQLHFARALCFLMFHSASSNKTALFSSWLHFPPFSSSCPPLFFLKLYSFITSSSVSKVAEMMAFRFFLSVLFSICPSAKDSFSDIPPKLLLHFRRRPTSSDAAAAFKSLQIKSH